MVSRNFHRHISGQYDSDLEAILLKFSTMGGLVESQLQDAMDAYLTGDSSLANKVRSNEEIVNQLEVEINTATTTVIAIRQPIASDLRLLIVMLKNGTDLERVGDESHRIAKSVLKEPTIDLSTEIVSQVQMMSELVTNSLRGSLDTFARFDEQMAQEIIATDARIDRLYAQTIDMCTDAMGNEPSAVNDYLSAIWVARALERIGDHAKNICENMIFLDRGENVSHTSKDPS